MAHETLVIDASVVVKWYCDEDDTDTALKIKERFFDNKCKLIAPDLLIYEVVNAVTLSSVFSSEERRGILEDLYSVGIEIVCPEEDAMASAMGMAERYGTTVYDAMYLALAKKSGCDYVTADSKFVEKVREKSVVHLSKYTP